MSHTKAAVSLLLGVLMLGACGNKKPMIPEAPVVPAARATTPPSDAGDRERAEAESRHRAEAERARATLEERVFFGVDRAEIKGEARTRLDAKVPLLRADPSIRLRIQGHADERGSIEYNMALGMRRAVSVRDYLAGYGVERSRMETYSFGDERPLDTGQTESSWARNRRAEFKAIAGVVAEGK